MDVPPQFERIVPVNTFLKHFASDRSHMLMHRDNDTAPLGSEAGEVYISPPPIYNPICGIASAEKGVLNNLMSGFVDMVSSERTFGHVLDRQAMRVWK
ncbi:hypothetical protein H0H87_012746 [Tephrocybe sp. NHM501043]|nr:hypothetical protein H0H87_012746 [Tephrocybe sp. NHM501043]